MGSDGRTLDSGGLPVLSILFGEPRGEAVFARGRESLLHSCYAQQRRHGLCSPTGSVLPGSQESRPLWLCRLIKATSVQAHIMHWAYPWNAALRTVFLFRHATPSRIPSTMVQWAEASPTDRKTSTAWLAIKDPVFSTFATTLSWTPFTSFPLDRVRTYLNHSGPLGKIVGGWELSSVSTWHTGHPLTVSMDLGGIHQQSQFPVRHLRANVPASRRQRSNQSAARRCSRCAADAARRWPQRRAAGQSRRFCGALPSMRMATLLVLAAKGMALSAHYLPGKPI